MSAVTPLRARLAFNPIPWYLSPAGWHPELAPPLPEMLAAIKRTGYAGVHAEVPQGSTPKAYLALLAEHGLAPASGYFHIGFSDRKEWPAVIETAKKVAAEHAALGLNRIFLAELFASNEARMKAPALGVEFDPARLTIIADGIGKAAEAMCAEGVTPCLHPHVNSWLETVEEIEAVLKAVPEKVLMFGPDTGHIAWAGGDPVAVMRKHAKRIGAVHIKDMRKAVAADGHAQEAGLLGGEFARPVDRAGPGRRRHGRLPCHAEGPRRLVRRRGGHEGSAHGRRDGAGIARESAAVVPQLKQPRRG